MFLTFGNYLLQMNKWESEGELSLFLKECDLGKIEFGEALYSGSHHYSITVFIENKRLGIGVYTDNLGLQPCLLLNFPRLNLVLGFGQEIYVFHVPSKEVVVGYNLGYPFQQFHTLAHLGINEIFLAQYEVGLSAFSFDGKQLWNYEGDDVLTNIVFTQSAVLLEYMEFPDKWVTLDIISGDILDQNPPALVRA